MYRYVSLLRVRFLQRFGLKTGIHFAHFGLESGMVFEGTTECINVFIVSIPNELGWKEKCANSKWLWIIFFVCALIYVMIAQFLPKSQVWKRVWFLEVKCENGCGKLHSSCLKSGQDLKNWAAHLHQQQQHQKLYLHDHKGLTVLQKLLV